MAQKKSKGLKLAYHWILLIFALTGAILVNIVATYTSKRFDMTDDQRYSLAPSTQEFLEKSDSTFKGRVYIEIFLDGTLPAELDRFRDAIEDKLKEFKNIAGDRIEYKFTDPKMGSKQDVKEREYKLWDEGHGILPMNVMYTKDGHQSQMRLWPAAIMQYGGASDSRELVVQLLPGTKSGQPFVLEEIPQIIENATRNLEYNLMNGLRRVTREKTPTIGFLQGHGELNFGATYRARSIIGLDYSVKNVTIDGQVNALDEVDGLVIAGPTQRFSNEDLYVIDQFVMRGGRLMCFTDALEIREDTLAIYKQTHTSRIETGLSNLLFDYGIGMKDNYVLDAKCAVKAISLEQNARLPWFYHVLATPTSHPVSRNVEPVSLKYTSELELNHNMKNVVVTPILQSSTNATATGSTPLVTYAIPMNYIDIERGEKVPKLALNPKSKQNIRDLAAVSQGTFKSYFKTRLPPEFKEQKELKYLAKSSKEGKVFVVGNSRMIQNEYDSVLNATGQEFMYRPKSGVNDLLYDRELVSIRFPHLFGNQDFFQNLVDFMMDDNSVLDIRSRQIEIRNIDKTKVLEESSFYKLVNVGLPIAIILVLALAMFFIRKRKYAR